MKQIIIETSSIKGWDFSVVIQDLDCHKRYFYFNNLQTIVKEICRSMITGSHYGNLNHSEFDLYVQEIIKLCTKQYGEK